MGEKIVNGTEIMFESFLKFLDNVIDNQDRQCLTHREVKFLAQGFLVNFSELNIHYLIQNEVQSLLKFIASGSQTQPIPHYQRAFYAQTILKLIEENNNPQRNLLNDF